MPLDQNTKPRHRQHRKTTKMPPYDSESSDGEDYTETNVLLGYATKQATGDAVSHIGGEPVSRLLAQTPCTRLTAAP